LPEAQMFGRYIAWPCLVQNPVTPQIEGNIHTLTVKETTTKHCTARKKKEEQLPMET